MTLFGVVFPNLEWFERFSSKIRAVWAVWAVFWKKPLKPLKSCLKNRSFLAVIFERFFKQDLSGFWAVFRGRGPRLMSILSHMRCTVLWIPVVWGTGSFSFSPHLQIFTCLFVDHIVQLLWKFTYRLIRPRQTYLVFILNLVKPLVTLINWSSCDVGGEKEKEPRYVSLSMNLFGVVFPKLWSQKLLAITRVWHPSIYLTNFSRFFRGFRWQWLSPCFKIPQVQMQLQ